MYKEIIREILSFGFGEVRKIVFSSSKTAVQKIVVKPLIIKNVEAWQGEKFMNNQAFHENIQQDSIESYLSNILNENDFRQVNIICSDKDISFKISKKKKIFRTESTTAAKKQTSFEHNKKKKYILEEGMKIDALVELGVFDKDYRIIKSKNAKFKQINKFIEIISDGFKDFKGQELTVIDFGCGKSYLTFIVYYYFTFIKNINVKIIGYDIKKDVVENCNKIAEKYSYNNLEFVLGDISKIELYKGKVDMIITLHACDTATDYALDFAIKNKIKYIFSVPCCQHEVNSQIKADDELNLLLKRGLYKERFSAILTDCIRCEILESKGYEVDVVEFVSYDISPKNAMIRGTLKKDKEKTLPDVEKILSRFGLSQTLYELTNKE